MVYIETGKGKNGSQITVEDAGWEYELFLDLAQEQIRKDSGISYRRNRYTRQPISIKSPGKPVKERGFSEEEIAESSRLFEEFMSEYSDIVDLTVERMKTGPKYVESVRE